jgi:hypothetical protein
MSKIHQKPRGGGPICTTIRAAAEKHSTKYVMTKIHQKPRGGGLICTTIRAAAEKLVWILEQIFLHRVKGMRALTKS